MQELFNWITGFFSTGLYDLITQAFASMIEWLTLAKLQWMLWAIGFCWDIAKALIADLGITEALRQAWGNLDSSTANVLMFFRIPDAVNLILGGFGTKFVMRFLGIGV